ncbi:MAG: PQQ-binding-like beta-propeller repeat protein [Polyangiaceae bacterium]
MSELGARLVRVFGAAPFASTDPIYDLAGVVGDRVFCLAGSYAQVMDAATGRTVRRIPVLQGEELLRPSCSSLSRDGGRWLLGFASGELALVSTEDQRVLWTTRPASSSIATAKEVVDVALSPDGLWAAALRRPRFGASAPWVVEIWRDGAHIGDLFGAAPLEISPDGTLLWAGDRLLDPLTAQAVVRLDVFPLPRCVAFSQDGNSLVAGFGDGAVRTLDLTTGKQRWQARLESLGKGVEHVAFFDRSGSVFAGGTAGYSVFSAEDGSVRRTGVLPGRRPELDAKRQRVFAISESSKRLVVGEVAAETAARSEDGKATHDGAVTAVAFSPCGRLAASSSEDGVVLVRRIPSGRLVQRFELDKPMSRLAFTTDRASLFAGGSDRIWSHALDVASGGPGDLAHAQDLVVAPSSEGEQLALPGRNSAVWLVRGQGVWIANHSSGAGPSRLLPNTRAVTRLLGASHDESLIAIAVGASLRERPSLDGVVEIWSVEEQTCLFAVDLVCGSGRSLVLADRPTAVAFSPDRTALLVGSERGSVYLFAMGSGLPRHVFCDDPEAP